MIAIGGLLSGIGLWYKSDTHESWMYLSGAYLLFLIETACMIAWGWTLWKLYRDVKNAQQLLPNKRIFQLHASVLVLYLIVFLAYIIAVQELEKHPSGDSHLVWGGIVYLLLDLDNTTEILIFFLVAFLMNPVTQSLQNRHQQFQMFLFNGFVDKDHLESAILAQNPDLTGE